MRTIPIALILLVLCLIASADTEITDCKCRCPEAPDREFREINSNGIDEYNCQTSCGGICGGMSRCGLNLVVEKDCDTCCDSYCLSVTPAQAKTSCITNCNKVCETNSSVMSIASMLSYIAVAVAALLLAVCGIGFLTANDPETRETAKKCIFYVLIGLLVIGLAAFIVALFTGIEIGSGPVETSSAQISAMKYIGTC